MGYITVSKDVSAFIEQAGNVIFFEIVGIFSFWILKEFAKNLNVIKGGSPEDSDITLGKIVNKMKFTMGLAGLVVFTLLLVVGNFTNYTRSEYMGRQSF